MKVREQTFRTGKVKTQRGHGGGNYGGSERDKVRKAYYREKTMLTVPSGAQTHLSFLLLPQSLSGCSFFTAAFTPQSSPLLFALKNYEDKEDISNMATR